MVPLWLIVTAGVGQSIPLSESASQAWVVAASRSDDHGDRLRPDLFPWMQGQSPASGVTQVGEHIWLVTFMQYDLGYFDDETCRLEPIENPFGSKVLPLRSE